uniref:thymidylate synthase n=1 Tax=Caulobacter sp. (strain K31) TaxID=366602 RepID=B0T6R4_CAUSK
MYLKANTLDDLLDDAFKLLLKSKMRVSATKGTTVEEHGVVLELTRPRARLSRAHMKGHVFSCIGEFIWYISCSNRLEPVEYYISRYKKFAEKDGTVWGAYGPRIFGGDRSQYEVVKEMLSERPSTRKAVIQLFDREDVLQDYNDIPCTCTMQFLVRDGMLNLVVHMRSNDVYMGLPHDIFAFTMIQEILAHDLGFKLGTYKHMVGSFHLYDHDREKVEQYLKEGFQPTREMPAMPSGNQWGHITALLKIEDAIRRGGPTAVSQTLSKGNELDPYWADIARLFAIYALTKGFDGPREQLREVVELRKAMSNDFYATYIRKRAKRLTQEITKLDLGEQSDLPPRKWTGLSRSAFHLGGTDIAQSRVQAT